MLTTNPTVPDRESVAALPATMTADATAHGHHRLPWARKLRVMASARGR